MCDCRMDANDGLTERYSCHSTYLKELATVVGSTDYRGFSWCGEERWRAKNSPPSPFACLPEAADLGSLLICGMSNYR